MNSDADAPYSDQRMVTKKHAIVVLAAAVDICCL
jgi:hypothetical protein